MTKPHRKIAFLHIPKTAGTTIHHLIADHHGPIVFYSPRSTPEIISEFGNHFYEFENTVTALPPAESKAHIQRLNAQPIIGGHTGYALFNLISKDRFTITSLRRPMDRLISFYFHYVFPERKKHIRPYREQTKEMKFQEFLDFAPLQHETENTIVRYLSGCPNNRLTTEEDLDVAKRHLKEIDQVIFQSSMQRGIKELATALNWKWDEKLNSTHLKIGTNRKRLECSADLTLKNAERYIFRDNELFQYAEDYFGNKQNS